MKKSILTIIQACVFIAFLLASESVFAEGSATLYPSGATGKRASLNARSRTVPRLFDIFPTPGTMKVYVKAGETLYVGSSAQGISQTYGTPSVTYTGKINLRAPNGNTYSSGTSTTVGLIANRTEELAGPDRTGVTTGYTPFTRVVQSAEEGIWEVDFVPPTNPDTLSVPQYNIDANASWVQQKRAMIVAWDVSVGSASNPATLIPGRVFTNNFNGNLAASSTVLNTERLDVTFYLLTDAGYKFRVKTNGFNGKSFNFFVNNKGVQNTSPGSSVTTTPLSWKDGTASYSSKAFTQTDLDNNVNSYLYDPREPDNSSLGNPDITHKIFYNTPATDLPTSAPIRYNGGASTTTWLVPSTYPSSPTISNLSVVGVESGTTGLVGPDGAYIRFNSNVPGTYTITLTFSTGTARTLTGNCVAGLNQIFWDGKNGSGATVSSGVTVTAQNTIRSGEMHFPFEDVEINPNGIIIELLQSNNSLFSPNQDIVYWNDTGLSGGTSSSPLDNSTTGSSSNSNGHKWGAYGSTIESDFGNNKLLDTWTYVKGSASSPATTISYKSLDLAVSSITPNVSSVVVGNTITYTIVVTNPSSTGYTDNAVGASFGFTAPAGFNITSATAVQNSGTFSETSRSTVSGNTFSSVFNLTSNGQATYTITGTVGTTMAHTSAAATAYVMRPADYTDKDATSAIVGAPTNPQTECDGGTSGTGCNNIKTSSSTTISNSTPVAVNDAGSVNEDATLTVIVPGVKTNDTDADGDALTVASIRKGESEGNGTPGTLGTALAGNYGTLNILADGSYTYIANNAQSLAAGATAHDYFNYTISDGNGGTDVAVIDITITGTNDAPVAVNDAGAVNEDATLTVPANGVLGNDTDVDTGNTKTVTSVRTGNTEGSGTEVSAGAPLTGTYGQLTLNADGSYTYIANNAQALPAGATAHDYFNYTMSDGTASDIAVIDITITGTNDAPVAVDNNYTTAKNTQITGNNIITNDSDPDNDELTVTGFSINGTSYSTGQTIEIYNGNKKAGTIIIYPNGDFVFTPENGHTGAVPVINYTITDGNLTASANINITIDNVNKVPVAVDDNNTTPEDTPASGNVVTNDTDGDNDILTVTQFEVQNKIYNAGETATILGIGTITIGSTGAYTFTPETNYNGVVPTITYTITDGVVTDKADLNITVTPVNDPPVAINDVNTTLIDTQVSGRVMTNDFDPENKPLTVTAITKATTGLGSVTIYADGTYTYTPLTGFTGEDTFTYQVCDNGTPALCVEATVTIEVMPLPTAYNDVPVAVNDAYQGSLNRTVTGSVTANDFDADNDVLTVVANANGKYDSNGDGIPDMQLPIGTPQTVGGVNAAGGPVTNAGSLKQNADGTFTFEPATGFVGQVTYSYVISDGKGGTDDAFVTIDITRQGANTTNALNDVTTTSINTAVSGNVLSNDYDRQGNTMTVTNPGTYTTASGELVIAANGAYTFTPTTGFTGDYNFTYTMCDNGTPQACEDAILTITVMPLPTAGSDLPVALNNMYIGGVNTTITENVLVNDIDVDQNGLTVITNAAGKYDSNGDGIPDTELQIGSPTQVWGINTSNQPVLAGELTQNASGLVTFVPVTNFVGQVNYSYVVKDGDNDTDAANVTLEIRGGNSTFATDDAYFGFVNMPVTGNMLANDYDPQGNTQTVNTTPVIAPLNGTVTINAIGTFTYTPKQDFMGPDYFVYRLCDNATMTACDTATVYINMLPEKVIAKDDINQTRQDIPVSGQLMTNDEGVTSITGATIGGESFTFGIAKQVAGVDRDGIPVANAGSLTINDDGTYTFTPATGFGGTVNPVTYTGTGANGGNDNAILSIEVLPELFPGYNPPVAQNDVMTTEAGATVTSTVINNDSDPDGDPVTVTSASIALNSPVPVAGKDTYGNTVANAGTVTLRTDGSYTYQPAAGFTGTVNDITYTISDGKGGTDTAILSINVIGDNGNNTFANDDAKAAPQGVTMTGSVLTNDTDPEGNTQKVVSVTIPAQTINGISVPQTALTLGLATVIANVGTITITEEGIYTFVPAASFTGTLRIPYNMEDNGTTVASDQATLYLTSTPKTVIAENDIKQTPQDIPASGQLMTNDEGVTSITGATIGGETFTFGIAKQVAGVDRNGNTVTNAGSLTINGDGTYTFTPATGFVGTVNPVTYTGADVNGGNDNAILSIEVFPKIISKTNPPVAQNDVNTTEAGATVTSTVLNNDSDPDGDPLTVTSASIALGSAVQVAGKDTYGNTVTNAGTVTLRTDGSYTYQPAAGFTGTVNDITYTISDGKGGTDTAILSINVIGDNGNNTFANDDAKAAPQGVTMTGSVLANDNDPEGNTQEVVSVTIPAQTINGISVPETALTVGSATVIPNVGTITITEGGIYTFIPATSFTGTLRIKYNIEDNGTTVAGDEATLYLSSLETINLWKGSTNPTTGTLWNTASNWVDNRVPGTLEDIEFATEANNPTLPGVSSSGPAVNNLVVPVGETNYKKIGNLTNETTFATVIPAGASLTVAGQVYGSGTNAAKLQVQAAKDLPNGTLILAGQPCNSVVMGTVQLYAKGFKDEETSWKDEIPGSPTNGVTFYGRYHWQHFGVPVTEVRADPTFYKSYLRKYHEDWNKKVPGTDPDLTNTYYAKWENLVNGSMLKAFEGYEITQDVATTYTIAGNMNYCDKTITLTRKAPLVHESPDDTNINNRHYGLGQNIFGNSYTASIDITKMDFASEPQIEPTVYLYNTGRFTDWATNGNLNAAVNSEDLSAGMYTSIPKENAVAIYDGRIPSMNGFLLIHRGPKDTDGNYYTSYPKYPTASDTIADVRMTLPYIRELLPNTRPQTAPRKALSYLRVGLASKSTRDNLWLFSQEGTTDKLDDGWDGRKFFGTPTAFIYTENADGPMQVSTNETIDGSVLSFYANSDTEYTLTLAKSNLEDYTDLHLIDLINRTATPLSSDTTRYHFTANNKGSTIKRFIIANSANINLNSDKFSLLHGYVKENSKLVISNFTSEEGIVNLFDISGKRFINTKMPVSVSEIPVTLEPGVYILDLQADGKCNSIKIIIK